MPARNRYLPAPRTSSHASALASRPLAPAARPRRRRLARLARLRVRRLRRHITRSLLLFGGWTWVAAGSLVGFEVLDIMFGAALVLPELVPFVVVAFAILWLLRERIRALVARLRRRHGPSR